MRLYFDKDGKLLGIVYQLAELAKDISADETLQKIMKKKKRTTILQTSQQVK